MSSCTIQSALPSRVCTCDSLLSEYGEYVRKDLDIVIKGGEKLLFFYQQSTLGRYVNKGPPRDN